MALGADDIEPAGRERPSRGLRRSGCFASASASARSSSVAKSGSMSRSRRMLIDIARRDCRRARYRCHDRPYWWRWSQRHYARPGRSRAPHAHAAWHSARCAGCRSRVSRSERRSEISTEVVPTSTGWPSSCRSLISSTTASKLAVFAADRSGQSSPSRRMSWLRGDDDHVQLVDLVELLGLGQRRAGHPASFL